MSITLDANDVYKELRVRGYDYGPKFRGVQELRFENINEAHGKIQWTGNWITFMDSMLQIQAMSLVFRNLLVPVMIKSLRCDPKILFDAIEKSKQIISFDENSGENDLDSKTDGNDKNLDINEFGDGLSDSSESNNEKSLSVLQFYANFDSKIIATNGVEIKGLWAAPIHRKPVTEGLKLESYEFVANEDNEAINAIDKKEITEYIQV